MDEDDSVGATFDEFVPAASCHPTPQISDATAVDPDMLTSDLSVDIPLPSEEDPTDTPNIDLSFMYRGQALHDPLWTALDETSDEEVGEGDEVEVRVSDDSDDELDEPGYIDWDKFRIGEGGQLSSWDQLGAGYEKEFASIGTSANNPAH
jgi:hypothetical protein